MKILLTGLCVLLSLSTSLSRAAETTKLECTYPSKGGGENSVMVSVDYDNKIFHWNERKYTAEGQSCDPFVCVVEKMNDDEIRWQEESRKGTGISGGTIYRKTGKFSKWQIRMSGDGRNSWDGTCQKLTDNKF